VDVYITSSEAFKLGSGQFYLNYNTLAFGENISTNGNIVYSQPAGSILGEVSGFPVYKDFIQNDNTSSRVSLSFQQGVSSGTIVSENVTTSAKLLCHIQIKYSDSSLDPEVCFETDPVFLDQFFTACGPTGSGFPDCSNHPGTQIFNDTFDCSGAALGTLSTTTGVLANIRLYPNPTKDRFYIQGLEEETQIAIYDLNGRLVHQVLDYRDSDIDISDLESAMYLVNISNSQGILRKRLVKD